METAELAQAHGGCSVHSDDAAHLAFLARAVLADINLMV